MSLRARLALTFATVVAVSLLVATLSLWALLRGYGARLVQARLDDIAVVVLLQARGMLVRGETPAEVLDSLSDQAEELEVQIALLDRQGRVVRESGRVGSLAGLQIPLERARPAPGPPRARQPMQGAFTSPRDGTVFLYAAVPLVPAQVRAPEAAVLLVAQPEGSPLTTLGPLLQRLGLAAGAGLLAGLVAAVLLARWLGRPVARLLAATEAIARGDYRQRVRPDGPPELARLSAGFNRMAAEVERARAIVHRFIGTLSHELRTPLTSIRGFARAVLDGSVSGPDELRRAMEIVDHEARRMQRLSAELLDLSRLQAGQVPLQREAVDLVGLVEQCVEVLAGQVEDRRVSVELDLPPELAVEGDADRLEQVFTNLLDNAVKFTPPGQRIRVRGWSADSPAHPDAAPRRDGLAFGRPRGHGRPAHRSAVVEVSNPGPPIPTEELPRIFEPFYTTAAGRERGGTGLGLPIAREIVRAHGGELRGSSDDGLTTFRVTLPAEAERRDGLVTPTPLTATRSS